MHAQGIGGPVDATCHFVEVGRREFTTISSNILPFNIRFIQSHLNVQGPPCLAMLRVTIELQSFRMTVAGKTIIILIMIQYYYYYYYYYYY